MKCIHELPTQSSLGDVLAIVTLVCTSTNPSPALSHAHQTTQAPTLAEQASDHLASGRDGSSLTPSN